MTGEVSEEAVAMRSFEVATEVDKEVTIEVEGVQLSLRVEFLVSKNTCETS